jgi:hypothetical protein
MRNVAISLGNLLRDEKTDTELKNQARRVLQSQYQRINALVDEHIAWALYI